MKKNMIVGIALAMGILSVGAISASAADTCGKCADNQAIQQFKQETDSVTSTLKVSFFTIIHPPEPLIFQEHSPTPFSRAFTHLG